MKHFLWQKLPPFLVLELRGTPDTYTAAFHLKGEDMSRRAKYLLRQVLQSVILN